MKTLLGLAIFLGAFAAQMVMPAQQPEDVNGWRDAQWGMTDTEVLDAFKGEATRPSQPQNYAHGRKGLVHIQGFTLASGLFHVAFVFDNDSPAGRLVQINLQQFPSGDKDVYRGLEKLLTEKYGPPTYQKEEGRPRRNERWVSRWHFPTTTIELEYLDTGLARILFLTYQVPTKEKGKI